MEENAIGGIKQVSMNEPFFVGHFPEEPVMPGVLLVEAMAQAGGIIVLNGVEHPEEYSTYFLRIDNVRFKQIVKPGDLCEVTAVLKKRRGPLFFCEAVLSVAGNICCKGELSFALV